MEDTQNLRYGPQPLELSRIATLIVRIAAAEGRKLDSPGQRPGDAIHTKFAQGPTGRHSCTQSLGRGDIARVPPT